MSRRKKTFSFFLWHRRLGLSALILVFILSITGIMLNHTEDLKLDEALVESEFILSWYGINPQGKPVNYYAENIWISQWEQQLFFNGNSLYTHREKLNGIVKINDVIAIALENFILLIDNNGEIIELMPSSTEYPVKKIGNINNRISLLDTHNNTYISDTDFTVWHKHNQQAMNWSVAESLSDEKVQLLKKAYRGQGINLERVILDLHSGRIFNARWGIYIMDISALLMIFLGLSGMWVWWSRKLKMRKKKHYQKHH